MVFGKIPNGFGENPKPIPDNKPDNKPIHTDARENWLKPDLPSKDFVRAVQARWNAMASLHDGMPRLEIMLPMRLGWLRSRLADVQGDESAVMRAIDNVPNDPHRLGNTQGGWRADFDWVFKDSQNFLKCLESQPQPKVQNDQQRNSPNSISAIGQRRRERRGALLEDIETAMGRDV